MAERGIMHPPQPGPDYWDWRCLLCSGPVSQHAPWWKRVFGMVREKRRRAAAREFGIDAEGNTK